MKKIEPTYDIEDLEFAPSTKLTPAQKKLMGKKIAEFLHKAKVEEQPSTPKRELKTSPRKGKK